jgi:hypothetical protein
VRIPATLSLVVLSGVAAADTPPLPQPALPGGVTATAKAHAQTPASAVASPLVMETTATVAPDGSLTFSCRERAGPTRPPLLIARPAAEPRQ